MFLKRQLLITYGQNQAAIALSEVLEINLKEFLITRKLQLMSHTPVVEGVLCHRRQDSSHPWCLDSGNPCRNDGLD